MCSEKCERLYFTEKTKKKIAHIWLTLSMFLRGINDNHSLNLTGVWNVLYKYLKLLKKYELNEFLKVLFLITFTFSHLADAFIQSDLQLGST